MIRVQIRNPTPHAEITFIITRTPTIAMATSTPTRMASATPSPTRPTCLAWDSISDPDIGEIVCVYGKVRDTRGDEEVFYILFGFEPNDFYLVHYGGVLLQAVPGICIQVRGQVIQLGPGGRPLMVVNEEDVLRCED